VPPLPLSHPTPTLATPFHRSILLFLLKRYWRSRLCSRRCLNGASAVVPRPPSSMSSRTSASRKPSADVAPRRDCVEPSRCKFDLKPIVALERTLHRRSCKSAASPSPSILPLRLDGGVSCIFWDSVRAFDSTLLCPRLERAFYRETACVEQQKHDLERIAKDVLTDEVRTDLADNFVLSAFLRWPWPLVRQSSARRRVSSGWLSYRTTTIYSVGNIPCV
jgi:hypothetical protein